MTVDAGAAASADIRLRTCPLCEAMCGLQLHVEDGRVTLIRPNRDDVWSKGFICPKGTTLGHIHEDPDRVRVPMVRDGETWREVSWDDAFARCEELLRGVIDRHGMEAVTAFVGNPTAHNYSLSRYVAAFIAMSGISPIYSSGTVDQWPKNVVCQLLYGNMWQIPAPDVARTHYWLVMGANPHASMGSLLARPDVLGDIERIRERGGRTVVVDPRRTGTAERADEWVPIVPGTDAAFLLAIVHVLFSWTASTTWTPSHASSRPRSSVTPAVCPPRRFAVSRTRSPPRRAPRCTGASGCATRSSARSRRGSSTS